MKQIYTLSEVIYDNGVVLENPLVASEDSEALAAYAEEEFPLLKCAISLDESCELCNARESHVFIQQIPLI